MKSIKLIFIAITLTEICNAFALKKERATTEVWAAVKVENERVSLVDAQPGTLGHQPLVVDPMEKGSSFDY